MRLAVGMVEGLAIALIVILMLWGSSKLSGPSPLEQRLDRNARITVAAERGLRCILRDTRQDQPEKDQQRLFNRCYAEFDELVGNP